MLKLKKNKSPPFDLLCKHDECGLTVLFSDAIKHRSSQKTGSPEQSKKSRNYVYT